MKEMKDSGTKLVRKDSAVTKWALPATAMGILAVLFVFIFWPFAIVFAIIAMVIVGYSTAFSKLSGGDEEQM